MIGKNILFICLFLLCRSLWGQDLHLASYFEQDFSSIQKPASLKSDLKANTASFTQKLEKDSEVSPVYLPQFARKNPTGYTYLCRLELQIEKELPLGLWLDIGDQSTVGNPSNANANLRFRFKLRN